MEKSKVQERAIIRERGQLTLPDKIRELLPWLSPNSPVTVSNRGREEVLIRPFENGEVLDWEKIWYQIELSRSFKGKVGNLSKIIEGDRQTR